VVIGVYQPMVVVVMEGTISEQAKIGVCEKYYPWSTSRTGLIPQNKAFLRVQQSLPSLPASNCQSIAYFKLWINFLSVIPFQKKREHSF